MRTTLLLALVLMSSCAIDASPAGCDDDIHSHEPEPEPDDHINERPTLLCAAVSPQVYPDVAVACKEDSPMFSTPFMCVGPIAPPETACATLSRARKYVSTETYYCCCDPLVDVDCAFFRP